MTESDDRLRERVRAWMDREHRGKVTAAAREVGVSHVMLGEFLRGTRGAEGKKMLLGLSRVLGTTSDELLGVRAPAHTHDAESVRPVFGSIRGANAALVRAKRREPYFPAFSWEDALATAPLIPPAHVTADMLIAAARLAISLRSPDALEDAEGERLDAEEAEREARQVEGERIVREAAARGERLSLAKVMHDLREKGARAEDAQAKARDAASEAANDAPAPAANDVPPTKVRAPASKKAKRSKA